MSLSRTVVARPGVVRDGHGLGCPADPAVSVRARTFASSRPDWPWAHRTDEVEVRAQGDRSSSGGHADTPRQRSGRRVGAVYANRRRSHRNACAEECAGEALLPDQFRYCMDNLALTIHLDGTSDYELVGASTFPRHWIYGSDGALAQKSGVIDFDKWYREAHEQNTPWGAEDSAALVTAVETALERDLSLEIMRGQGKRTPQRFSAGDLVVEQGDASASANLFTSCSTERSRSSSTTTWSESSGQTRSSASARSLKTVHGRRLCARNRRAS
jgi:hypothetical protein